MEKRVFVMAGGGTGGHVIPGLAVARELAARGHQPLFIGTHQGLEARLVPEAGFPIEWIEIGGLKGLGWSHRLRTLLQLPKSIADARDILLRNKAAGVFSMGGYAAAPVVLAAATAKIPVVLMEPNAMPGLTNRRLARFARKALVGFQEAAAFFPNGRAEVTGRPVPDEFFSIQPKETRSEPPVVLVTGGSRGSRTLNNATRALWPLLRAANLPLKIVLQTGPDAHQEFLQAFEGQGVEGEVVAFIQDMPSALEEADLVVCRSGGTVAELAAAGRPSVLVPYPYAADDHQMKNALAMERPGAARVVHDKDFTGERMLSEIQACLLPGVLETMAKAAKTLAKPGAAARAATLLEQYSEETIRERNVF